MHAFLMDVLYFRLEHLFIYVYHDVYAIYFTV